VQWLVQNAASQGSLDHLLPQIYSLRVVDGCDCGCPSVDFVSGGQSSEYSPIANAIGSTLEGDTVGVILWGDHHKISGLEIHSMSEGAPTSLPSIDSLKPQ